MLGRLLYKCKTYQIHTYKIMAPKATIKYFSRYISGIKPLKEGQLH